MAQMDIYEAKIDLSDYASWGGDHHYPLVEVKGDKVHIDIDDIEFVITTETATYLLQNLADKLDYRAIELTTSEKIEKAKLLKEVERVEKKEWNRRLKNYLRRVIYHDRANDVEFDSASRDMGVNQDYQ